MFDLSNAQTRDGAVMTVIQDENDKVYCRGMQNKLQTGKGFHPKNRLSALTPCLHYTAGYDLVRFGLVVIVLN